MKVGDIVSPIVRIGPIPQGASVLVLEIRRGKKTRHKDRFGQWVTEGDHTRIRVGYHGADYWLDGDMVQ